MCDERINSRRRSGTTLPRMIPSTKPDLEATPNPRNCSSGPDQLWAGGLLQKILDIMLNIKSPEIMLRKVPKTNSSWNQNMSINSVAISLPPRARAPPQHSARYPRRGCLPL